MKTTLRDEVEIREIVAPLELAVEERHPELQLLCAGATADGLTDASIDAVLPGLSARAKKNLRRHCEDLKLCDGSGRLTALGRRCAGSGEVPVPEQGVYTIWAISHPLTGTRILHFRRERPDPNDLDLNSLQPVEEWLRRLDPERIFTSAAAGAGAAGGNRFSLWRFLQGESRSPPCRPIGTSSCALVWDLDFDTGRNEWRLEGALPTASADRRPLKIEMKPEAVEALDLWKLFAAWESRWDPRRKLVAIPLDPRQVPADGRDGFRRTLRYKPVRAKEIDFEEAEVADVPVGPIDAAEAQRWAATMLERRLAGEPGYLDQGSIRTLFDDIVRGTPLAALAPTIPDEAARHRWFDSPVGRRSFWLIAAPSDLEPPARAGMGRTS